LIKFLGDFKTQEVIFNPFTLPWVASTATRSAFDTLTSAINVTPDANAPYNIDELKQDALWLVKKFHIDEVTALRLAVVEWQSRSKKLLLSTIETSKELRQSVLGTSINKSFSAIDAASDSFNTQEQRRFRLTHIFFRMHLYAVKTAVLLVFYYHQPAEVTSPDLLPIAHEAVRRICKKDWRPSAQTRAEPDRCVHDIVSSLRQRLPSLEPAFTWAIDDEQPNEAIDDAWKETIILEFNALLQLIYFVYDHDLPSVRSVQAWFDFQRDVQWFEFQLVSALPSPWFFS
jgi:nuclear pore complex protein Nup188